MDQGYTALGGTMTGVFVAKDADAKPTKADATPTVRIYSASGFLLNATVSLLHSGSITAATFASPIVVTSAGHGLSTGVRITVSGVLGNTGANGTFTVTKISADTFSLDGSTGNAPYTSGGVWSTIGEYKYTVVASGANGFVAGSNYWAVAQWAISAVRGGSADSFGVT